MCNTISNQLTSNINPENLKPLFKTNSFRHVLDIVYNWCIIALTIFICVTYPSFLMYVLSVFIIGAKMHALAILMHDATHFRFLKNRKWNDLITNWITMYPIFTSIEKYRENHLRHHQHLNTDHDPDWVAKLGNRAFTFPKTKKEFLLSLLSYMVLYQGIMDAIWFIKRFNNVEKKNSTIKENKPSKLFFYILLFSGLTILGIWKYFLIFWVVPYFSAFFLYQYIRSVAEHFGDLAYEDDLSSSRTIKANAIERFFIAPHNVSYHLEHHLFPGVPYYNLPKLHILLMEQSIYESKAHITIGYCKGLLNELGAEKVEKHAIA